MPFIQYLRKMYKNNSKRPGGEKWKYIIVKFLSVPGT